jgi:orotate phosphoribosyltransferase
MFESAHLSGSFRLRSGRTTSEYFDKYRFESDPVLLAAIAEQLAGLVPAGTELLAGLELGGVPIATALSLCTGTPAVFVRKKAKAYGTARLAEGAEIAGRCLLIVEDVVTSGGQVAMSAADLRERGAIVTDALCVVDRDEGGREALAGAGLRLRALFTASQLKASAV